MKHLIFLILLMLAGAIGSSYHPFWGILLYYFLAILRPQTFWKWSLPVEWRWSLIAAGIVVVGLVVNLPKLLTRARANLIALLMVLYGVLLLLSCLAAYDTETAGQWGIEYAKIFFIALVATLVIQHLWQVRVMVLMILLTLGYIAWEVNFLYFFQGRLDIYHYGYGGLDNNGAGLMLAMGLPLAYIAGISAPRWWQKTAAWGIAVLLAHAVMMSYSRGAMLAGLLAVGWLLVHNRNRIQMAGLVVAGVILVSVLAGPQIRSRFMTTGTYEQDASVQSRFGSWSAAWQMAWDEPLLGHGIRNSNEFSRNYGADKYGRTIHSQYLQVAADSGIPAMCVYIALLVVALVWLIRSRWQCLGYLRDHSGHDPGADADLRQIANIALGCQGSLIAFAFGAVFLSLEVFELPWMILVIAGVMPLVVRHHLEDRAETPKLAITAPLRPLPSTPRSKRPPRPVRRRSGVALENFIKGATPT